MAQGFISKTLIFRPKCLPVRMVSKLLERPQTKGCLTRGGGSSIWVSINAVAPQGTILGPLLFHIYNNDVVKDINYSSLCQ